MRKASDPGRRAQGAAIVAALSSQPLALEKLLALSPQPSALAQSKPSSPIIVKIIQPQAKSDLEGLSDVLLGSLGLTGLITVAALLLGAALAGVMFWVRSRST
jgi:hypothetical protein